MASQASLVDLSDNRQPQLYGAFISTYVLAVTATVLRLSARKCFSKAGIWLDDLFVCVALLFATGIFVDMIIGNDTSDIPFTIAAE